MPPRTRSTPVQKASWRGRGGGPVSSPLLFYRRAVMTALSLALLACFALLIWFNWPSNREPLAASLALTDYARLAAPSVGFGQHDREKLVQVLEERFPGRAKELGDNADADAQHLAGVFAFSDGLFRQADPQTTLLVYVSGHGCSKTGPSASGDADEAVLLPVDFDPSDPQKAGLPVAELLKAVASRRAKCKILAIDFGPIERDLRLGTAVNRFAEVLERELAGVSLAKDERLVVITSHRNWERSLVSPADQRSVFSYFFTAALGDEEHAAEHADAVCPDGPKEGKSDQKISVAELARFVQTQVSQWVWQTTDFVRTQRPLVLVKAGSDKPLRLDFTARDDMPADARRLADELAQVMLCRVPAATADGKKEPAAEKAAKPADEDAKKTVQRIRQGSGLLGVLQLAQAAAGKTETSPTTPAAPPPAGAAVSPASPATAPAAATPPAVPPAEDLRPDWLKNQSRRLPELLAGQSPEWLPADFDLQFAREQLAALLDVQQRTLAGLVPERSGQSGPPTSRTFSASQGAAWNPPAGVDAAAWLAAVKLRNAILLQIGPLADAVERVEGPAAASLRSQFEGMIDALEGLVQLTDRNVLIQSRPNTRTVLYQAVTPTDEQCDVTLLDAAAGSLSSAHRKLLADLRAALAGNRGAAGAQDWLNAWELAQAMPLVLLEPPVAGGQPPAVPFPASQVAAPAWQGPKLAVQSAALTGKPKTTARVPRPGVTPESVEKEIQDRRRQWLLSQARLANLLEPSQPPISLAVLAAGPAINPAQLNRVAAQVGQRFAAAARRWAAFDPAAAKSPADHWQADRAGRLALTLPARIDAAPTPAKLLQAEPTTIRLGLSGPRLGASDGDIERASVLDEAKPTPVAWQIQRADPALLASVVAEIDYEPKDLQVVDARGRPLPPTQPGRPPLRLVELLDSDRSTLALAVRAQRQVEAEEAAKPGGNRKELAITLRLDGQIIGGAAAFHLPDSRYLDVLVAGHKATLERDALVVAEAQPEGWQWRQARPEESAGARGNTGDYRVEVSPFPRYQSSFGLKLVNRAAKTRKLAAQWHVAPQGPQVLRSWRQWQEVIDVQDTRAIRVPSQELKAGESWSPPLFVPPAPPAAGAAPAPPGPPLTVLNVENGLLLVLTDELDPAWQQRVWLRPRPLHPAQYLDLAAQFRRGPPRDSVVVSINAKEAIRTQLPPGPMPVEWFDLADPRIQPPPPAPRDFSLPDQKPITADLAPDAKLTGGNLLRAVLGVDGYPRAANFPAIGRLGEPARHVRQPYVQLQMFEETPAASGAPGAGPGPPVRRPLAKTSFVSRVPGLAYGVFADFDDRSGQSLRFVHNDNVGSALDRWAEDRQYLVRCRKPADPQGPQLAMDCEVREWQGSLGTDIRWLEEGQNILRAQIVQQLAGQEQPLGDAACQDQYVIVLDTRQPRITTDMAPQIDYLIGAKRVQIEFTVADGDEDQPEDSSGVAVEQIAWGTELKEDKLVAPRPIGALLEPGTIRPPQANVQTIQCELPADVTKEPGQVTIYVQATDRAGNASRVQKLCTIDVRKPRMLEKLPGGGKAAKGK